jgi:hypothetical protein
MKRFLLIGCLLYLCASCRHYTECQDNGDHQTLELKFFAKHLFPLRDREYYALWVRERPALEWKFVSSADLFSRQADTNLFYFRSCGIQSLSDLFLTIENQKDPSTPGATVLQSVITHTQDTAYATLTTTLPDADKISGAVTFTSLSSDSTAFTREFYLLKFSGATAEQSLQNLPPPPAGFRYGLWAYNTDFFPPQQFLYGTFTTPVGNDDDTAGDEYPFPGGMKKVQLNSGSGLIIVTLEPMLWGNELRNEGPSSYRLLQFERRKNIVRDSAYQMDNVASPLPSGYAQFVVWK